MNVYRHMIDYGESLRWEPPAGTGKFFVWRKIGEVGAAMRWRRVGGHDVAGGTEITVPEGTFAVPAAQVALAWGDVLALFDGFDPEVIQVTAHGDGEALIRRDTYTLPPPTSIDADTIAAQERRLLKALLDQRAAVADVSGMVKVTDPSGTAVEYQNLAALDRRVAEVRARIAWFEQAAAGNVLPRAEFW